MTSIKSGNNFTPQNNNNQPKNNNTPKAPEASLQPAGPAALPANPDALPAAMDALAAQGKGQVNAVQMPFAPPRVVYSTLKKTISGKPVFGAGQPWSTILTDKRVQLQNGTYTYFFTDGKDPVTKNNTKVVQAPKNQSDKDPNYPSITVDGVKINKPVGDNLAKIIGVENANKVIQTINTNVGGTGGTGGTGPKK